MSEQVENPPAFPMPSVFNPECGTLPGQEGMTLRDYFAAMVLQGLLAHHGDGGWHPNAEVQSMDGAAETAYEYADAMLAARNNQS